MITREGLHLLPDFSQAVAAVGCQVLRDAQFFQEVRAGLRKFFRRRSTVKVAQQNGDTLDNGGIRVGSELAQSSGKLRDEPDFGQAAFHTEGVRFELRFQRRRFPPEAHDIAEPVLRGFQGPQRRRQLPLFFRDCHFILL